MKKKFMVSIAAVMLSVFAFSSTAMASWSVYEANRSNAGNNIVAMKDTSWACALRKVGNRNNEDNDEMATCNIYYNGSQWYLEAYVQSGDADVQCKAICSKF